VGFGTVSSEQTERMMSGSRRKFDAAFKARVALEIALARFGEPEIFNTDQGAQFTSAPFTTRLEAAGIGISMDGRGRLDNVFVERLWRSLKYEEVHLKAYADGHEARAGIERMDDQLHCIVNRLDRIEGSIAIVDSHVGTLTAEVHRFGERLDRYDERFDRLEQLLRDRTAPS
jgi:transposase InsO family protein